MKKILILSGLLSISYEVMSQKTGMLLDSIAYQKFVDGYDMRQKSRGGRSPLNKIVQVEHSLKKYCPEAGYQGKSASCVGWATGYGALTILRAKQFNITNPEEVTQLAHSAAYIYNQIGESDLSGAYPRAAFKLLKEKGGCRNITFDSKTQFHRKPMEKQHQEAKRFKIKDYDIVTKPNVSEMEQLLAIKQKLMENLPIIICVRASAEFMKTGKYSPFLAAQDTLTHALCLIGFDDRNRDSTFEVFNSRGKKWGDNGFAKVRQRELLSMIREMYWMELLSSNLGLRTVEMVLKRHVQDESGRDILEEVDMVFDATAFPTYKAQKKEFDHKTHFDLSLRELQAEQHVYIFGKDAHLQWMDYARFPVEHNLVEWTRQYEFTQLGTEMVFMLFSAHEIQDYGQRFERMKATTGEIREQVYAGFGDLLSPSDTVSYLSYRVGVCYPKIWASLVSFSLTAED